MRRWLRPFWVVLALLFLLEAWLWDHLEPIVARLVNLVPWGKLKLWLARLLEDMPPWAALMVFAVPFIVLFPLKIVEFWLLAHGQWVAGIVVLVFAKLLGVGVTAFIFDVTRDKLLQMAWFVSVYNYVMWLRGWAHGITEPVRARVRRLLWLLKPERAGRFLRRLMRLRRNAYRRPS